jgi:tetratricopeptide (TPR) repeat protein
MRTGRIAALVLVIAGLSRPAAAGEAHTWTWGRPPDPAATRAAIAEMERIAKARPDLVRVTRDDAAITIDPIDDAGEPFRFPCVDARCRTGAFNVCRTLGAPYDEVVTASLLVAGDHFGPDALQIASDGGDDAWAAGRALYTRVLARAPPELPVLRVGAGDGGPPPGLGPLGALGWFRGTLGLILVIAVVGWLAAGRGGNASWGTYYLAWIVLPTAIAVVSAHPIVLAVAAVGLATRRWLPDPFLLAKHARRTRSLESQVRSNPANITACRDLAVIWLERRRPRRALRFVEQALVRDPDDIELRYLAALARDGTGDHEAAATALAAIAEEEPKYRHGEPWLRAGDALTALRRWDAAIAALRRFAERNRSSVEVRAKLARALRRAGDRAGAGAARADARETYHDLPGFQRRAQRRWYLRTFLPW